MPEQEVSTEEAEVKDQIPQQDQDDEVAYVEGLEPEKKPETPELPDEAAKTAISSAEPDKAVEKVESQEAVKIRELESKMSQLTRALHLERQKKQKEKEQTQEDVIPPDKLKAIIKEHGDDPETLFNVFDYMSRQAAKQVGKDTIDAQKMSQMKQANDAFVSTRWPALNEPDSDLRIKVDETKNELGLGNHPMADYLATSALVAVHMDDLKTQWYEAGRQAALSGKAEQNRKQDVKDKTLSKSVPASDKKMVVNDFQAEAVIKQLNLTPSAAKIYKSFLKKNKAMVEA